MVVTKTVKIETVDWGTSDDFRHENSNTFKMRHFYCKTVLFQKYSLQKMIGLKISKVESNLPQRTRNTAERDVALFWQYIHIF